MERLKELRKECKSRKIPIISPATEVFLRKVLKKKKPKICLEVWGAVGYSSIVMWEVIKDRWGKLISFEISYPAYQEGLQNTKKMNCYNTTTYPFDIIRVPIKKLMPEKVDFIFIDGQKSQYGEYMEIAEKILSPDTLIIIDDVIKYHNKLSSLYGYLQKKQIKLLRPSKKQMKGSFFEWKKNTDDLRNRKHKWNKVVSGFENSRVYKILQLDPDDWIMIING